MKKLLLILLPLAIICLGGCTDQSLYQRIYDLENNQSILFDNDDGMYNRLTNIESIMSNTGNVKKDCGNEEYKGKIDFEQSPEYCHKHNDIKLGDNVYFAYLGNRDTDYLEKQEGIKKVTIDGIEWYYDIQPVVKILWETIEGKNCITMINGYGTEPQKTYQDMVEKIKDYVDCLDYGCQE